MGVPGNNLAPMKIVLGARKVKLDPGVKLIGSCFIKYYTLLCIEPARFLALIWYVFSSNVNSELVTSLGVVLYSFTAVLFILF